MIPPWVEEHPDVFNDSNFSITQPATESSMYFDPVPMEMSVEPMEEIIAEPQRMAWVRKALSHCSIVCMYYKLLLGIVKLLTLFLLV